MTNFSEFPQLDTSLDPAPLGIFVFFFGSEVGRQIPLRIAVLLMCWRTTPCFHTIYGVLYMDADLGTSLSHTKLAKNCKSHASCICSSTLMIV